MTAKGYLSLLDEGLEAELTHAELLANEYAGEPYKASLAYDAMLFIQSALEKIRLLKEE